MLTLISISFRLKNCLRRISTFWPCLCSALLIHCCLLHQESSSDENEAYFVCTIKIKRTFVPQQQFKSRYGLMRYILTLKPKSLSNQTVRPPFQLHSLPITYPSNTLVIQTRDLVIRPHPNTTPIKQMHPLKLTQIFLPNIRLMVMGPRIAIQLHSLVLRNRALMQPIIRLRIAIISPRVRSR